MSVKWGEAEDEEGPSESLIDLFDARKEDFLESLERIIALIGSDRFIKQMFLDDNSALYIPNRVCEIVYHVLRDDREAFVKMLMERIQAFEACFGPNKARQIESIGNRLIEMSSHQALVEAEHRNSIKILKEQLSALQAELQMHGAESAPATTKLKQMKMDLSNMKVATATIGAMIKEVKAEIGSTKQNAKKQIQSFADQMESLKEENKRLKEQINTKVNDDGRDKLRKKLEKAASVLRDKDETIARLKIELSNVDAEQNAETQQKLHKAMKAIKSKDQEIEDLKNEIEMLKALGGSETARKLEKAKKVVQAKDTEIADLKDEIDNLKVQATQFEAAKQKLAKAKKILQEKTDECESLRNSASFSEDLRRNLENAKKMIKDKNERIRELESQADSPENRANLMKRTAKLERALARATEALKEKDGAIQELHDQIEDMERTRTEQLELESGKATKQEMEDLTYELSQRDREIRLLRRKLDQMETQKNTPVIEFMDDADGMTIDAIENLLDSVGLSGRARTAVARALSDAQRRVEQNAALIEELQGQKARLIKQNQDKDAEIDEWHEQDGVRSEQLRKKDAALQQAQTKLQRQEQKNNDLSQKFEELKGAHAAVVSDNKKLIKELQNSKARNDQLSSENENLVDAAKEAEEFLTQAADYLDESTFDGILRALVEMRRNLDKLGDVEDFMAELNELKHHEERLAAVLPSSTMDGLYDDVVELKSEVDDQRDVLKKLSKVLGVPTGDISKKAKEVTESNARFRAREKKIEKTLGPNYEFDRVSEVCEQWQRDSDRNASEPIQRRRLTDSEAALSGTVDQLKRITQTESMGDLSKAAKSLCSFRQAIMKRFPNEEEEAVIEIIEKEHKIVDKLSQLFGISDLAGDLRKITQEYEGIKRPAGFRDIHEQMATFKRLWNDEQSLIRVLGSEKPILEQVKELQRNHKKLQDKDENERRKGTVDKLQDIVNKAKEQLRVRNDNDVPGKIGELCDVVESILTELDIDNASEIESKLRDLRDTEKLMNEVRDSLGIRGRDDPCSLIEKHKKSHDDMAKIIKNVGKHATISDPSDVQELLERLIAEEKDVMDTLGTGSSSESLEKVKEMKDELEHAKSQIKKLNKLMGCANEGELMERVQSLMKVSKERGEMIQDCLRSLDDDTETSISDRLQEMLKTEADVMDALDVGSRDGIVESVLAMKKALADISKHVNATHTFYGTQPLSSRETREQRLADNVGTICQELNDMHKLANYLADQFDIDPKPQTFETLASAVKSKVQDLLANNKEIDEIASGNGNSRVKEVFAILAKICSLVDCDEGSVIAEIKDILDTLSQCSAVLDTNERGELVPRVQGLKSIVSAVGETLKESNESALPERVIEISKQKAESGQILSQLRDLTAKDGDIVDAVTELKDACDKVMKITDAEDLPDMVEKVGTAWKSMDKLKQELGLDHDLQSGEVVDAVLEQVHGQKNLLDSMEKVMASGSEKDILENMKELNEIVAKLQGMLSLDDRNEILDRVGKLLKDFRNILALLQTDEDDVVDAVTALKGDLKKMASIVQKAEKITDTNNPEDFLAALQQLKANEGKICDLVGESDAVQQVKALVNDSKKLQRALGCKPEDDMAAAVGELKKQLADAEKLIQKLQAISKCESESELAPKVQQLVTDEGKIGALLEAKEGESNVDLVRGNVQTLKKIATLVPDDQEPNLVNRVAAVKKALADANKLLDQLRKATQTGTNEELLREVKQMVSDMKKIDNALAGESGENLPEKAKLAASVLQRLKVVTDTKESKDIPQAVAELQKKYETLKNSVDRIAECDGDEDSCEKLKGFVAERKKLQAILGIGENESIPDKVKDLVDEMKRVGAHVQDSNGQVSDSIREMAESLDKLQDMLTKLEEVTSESGPDDVCAHVERLENEKSALDDILRDVDGDNSLAKVAALKNALHSTAAALECPLYECPDKVKSLKNEHGVLNAVLEKSKGAVGAKDGENLEDLLKDLDEFRQYVCEALDTESMDDAMKKLKEINDAEIELDRILSPFPGDNVIAKVTKAIEERGAAQDLLNKCLEITKQTDPEAMLEKLKELIDTDAAIRQMLDITDDVSLQDPIGEIKKSLDEIARQISKCHPVENDLPEAVRDVCGELLASRKLISGVLDLLGITPAPESLDDKSNEIYSGIRNLQKMKTALGGATGESDADAISERATEALEKLKEIDSLMPASWKGDVLDKVKALSDEFEAIRDITGSPEDQMATAGKVKELASLKDKLKGILKADDIVKAADSLAKEIAAIKQKLGVKGDALPRIEELLNFEKQVCDALDDVEKDQIPEAIEDLKRKCGAFEVHQRKMSDTLSEPKFEEIDGKIAELMESAKALEKIKGILQTQPNSETIDRVKALKDEHEKLSKMLKSDDVPRAVKAILDENEAMKEAQERALELMKDQNVAENELVDGVRELCSQLEDFKEKEKTNQSILNGQDLKDLSNAMKQIRKMLGTDGDVIKPLQALLDRENEVNKLWNSENGNESLGKLRDVYQTLSKTNDIPNAVKTLIEENKRWQSERERLTDLLPQSTGDIPEDINKLVKALDAIQKLTATESPDKAVEAVELLTNTASQISELLGNPTDVVAAVKDLVTEKERMSALIHADSTNANNLNELYKSCVEFLSRVLSALTNTDVKFEFPIAEPVKNKFLEIISAFVKEHQKNIDEISEVTRLARSRGYLEHGPLRDAVDYIVDTEVGNARNKIMEEMHAQVKSVREMKEKEKKIFDKSRDSYKQRITELRAQISEMQEKSLARDEECYDQVAQHKNITVEMERNYQREKRIHEELIRLLKNRIVDFAFLQENLTQDEYAALEKFKSK